jgi:hypothetical protein
MKYYCNISTFSVPKQDNKAGERDFSVHKERSDISTFPFINGQRGPGMPCIIFVKFRLFRSQSGYEGPACRELDL